MAPATLTDLPPELLDHVAAHLPTAQSVARLGAANRGLHAAVERDAWPTFLRARFPSLLPDAPPSSREAARTLTTLSRARQRRAFVAQDVEPAGDIRAYPGGRRSDRWTRPAGQTLGFTPALDAFEEVGPTWRDRKEVLALSAGAQVCVRTKKSRGHGHQASEPATTARWVTYRPLSAGEGRDDVTALHLLRPQQDADDSAGQRLVTGTANGDLRILCLPDGDDGGDGSDGGSGGGEVSTTYLTTQGQPVRSSSMLERPGERSLLAANTGDARISVYPVDTGVPKIAPLASVDVHSPAATDGQLTTQPRVWSTQFLSPQHLVAGIGLSVEPIYVYALTPSGLKDKPVRRFHLENDPTQVECEIYSDELVKTSPSSVYAITPLPASASSAAGSGSDSRVFLSGAYDGVIRLHDLRSHRDLEQTYWDPTDNSVVYSLLPRGQETLVAGTGRHSLLKFFDMRLGAKCYSYLNATASPQHDVLSSTPRTTDWNLFLRPPGAASRGSRNSFRASRRRESPVYSLAAPSPQSPYIYAGVEDAIVQLAFTSVLDRHPDTTSFAPWQPRRYHPPPADRSRGNWRARKGGGRGGRDGGGGGGGGGDDDIDDIYRPRRVLNLAMHDQNNDELKLYVQRDLWDTWRTRQSRVPPPGSELPMAGRLDERWGVDDDMPYKVWT